MSAADDISARADGKPRDTLPSHGTNVPHAVFTVENAPAKARYEIWHDSISCIFDVDAARELRNGDFIAQVDAHMFGPVMLARTQTLEQTWTRSPAIAARDGMDHYMIQAFESGHMTATHHRGETDIPKDGLIVFDLAEQVATRTDNFTNMSLILPRPMLARLLKRPDDQHMRTLSCAEPMVVLLRDYMLSLKRLAPRMTAEQAVELVPATAALVAACLNGSLEDIPTGDGNSTLRETTTMERCRRFIDAHLASPDLNPDMVAAAVGLSRSRLYRLFREGSGVAAYIRERRLRGALLALGDPAQKSRPIYDIALAFGFTSNSVFTRLFRQRYGVAPRDVRHGGSRVTTTAACDCTVDRRYEEWLNSLALRIL